MIGKDFLPKSLFGRALLILVLPTVLIQLVVTYVFFDRHWDNVSRHMSRSLAGEMAFLTRQLKSSPAKRKPDVILDFEAATGIDVFLDPPEAFGPRYATQEFPDFQEQLREHIEEPLTVRKLEESDRIETRISLPGQTLRLETTVKRLESRTIITFLVSMLAASAVFLLIAVLFMRNQIRPIRRLARAADNFGRGIDTPGFRPHGATEVRQAARAFIVMRERIKRQLKTRTDMLSGISHDLKTPLTRMKLQLAMMNENTGIADLLDDVHQMEHMIEEYLDFARGEGGEEAQQASLAELLADVASDYVRLSANVNLMGGDDVTLAIKPVAFRRMLHNIIDNALCHGKRCELSIRAAANYCEVLVDDDGPGIPAEQREEVFKPFVRLDASRNPKTGSVGLGLTIARDIAMAHGGSISLETSPLGGLRVVIRLPL